MAAPAPHRTDTLKESHWTAKRHGLITRLCEEAVAEAPAVRSLSHYSNGILDFAVFRASRAPLSSLVTEVGDEAQNESLPGSRLLLCAQDLGAVLRPLGTGELMRTVLANARGGLWGGRARPGEFLAAVTDVPDGVPAMDAAMNRLVTRIRAEVHSLPDEKPGGDPGAKPYLQTGATTSEGPQVDFGTAAVPDTLYEQRLRDLWRTHVNTTDLQYAGYYRDWTLVCVGDVFDAHELGPRFIDVSVRTRRTAYRDLSRSLRGHLVRLTDALGLVAPADAGHAPVDRLVLDVQEGAVYVLWTSPRAFLLGVTLDQRHVDNAERRLRGLGQAVAGVTVPPPR
ncbi:hypothetical protein [Streptomyces sporangiiformans]|uniref:Uncharacterized protein n=1 Tax=Streptomyces sporangiiformans TaxID=2315329 RepID=A0A505DHQ6_9ACTN|nr:hypothetical protein [Streptomyces sporangiiformans]TPQ21325.1 hypothetical protein FGD71_015720 [Streptomyces sporangiiformans]